jgi:SAM-dependent methyltransferase
MQPNTTLPRPAHLDARYGAQFEDESIAAAYHTRPPYPLTFFSVLRELHVRGPRRILELGSGTGDVTLGLLDQAEQIDAIEPSAEMLKVAQQREHAADRHIRWVHARAEDARLEGPYTLAVAAESLHWMEWRLVLPKIARALAPGAVLALAERGCSGDVPWGAELARLIPKYSTNQEFRPYDLVKELTGRGLFREVGQCTTLPVPFAQSIDHHVESMHSRNGFSRDRMDRQAASEFDHRFRQLLQRHCPDGMVRLQSVVTIVWGRPAAA